jgi:hypothetical protein
VRAIVAVQLVLALQQLLFDAQNLSTFVERAAASQVHAHTGVHVRTTRAHAFTDIQTRARATHRHTHTHTHAHTHTYSRHIHVDASEHVRVHAIPQGVLSVVQALRESADFRTRRAADGLVFKAEKALQPPDAPIRRTRAPPACRASVDRRFLYAQPVSAAGGEPYEYA